MSSAWTAKLRARWASRRSTRASKVARPGAGPAERLYDLTVFLGALAALWIVIPFGGFDAIIGDNIAQVAYWRILFDQAFAGSVGASSMKPGLIVLLGGAHDLSLSVFHSTVLIKAAFAVAGAGLSTIVARIARPVGGMIAGVGAVVYMLTQTPVTEMYVTGTSMIVFLPLLLWGVWLFSRGHDGTGAVVLCLAALIRIEAFAVLLWLSLGEQFFKRRWRAFALSTFVVAVTVVLTAAVYYRVQGSVARFNAGGPPVGYVFAREPGGLQRLLDALAYTASASAEMVFEQCGFPYLAIPALLAFAFSESRRHYLSLLGIPLFLLVYIGTGQGNTEVRYFQFLAPVTAAFGASGIALSYNAGTRFRAHAPRWLWMVVATCGMAGFVLDTPKPVVSSSLLFIAAALGALVPRLPFFVSELWLKAAWAALLGTVMLREVKLDAWPPPAGRAAFTLDAKSLLRKNSQLPRGQRVLTEDDLIYSVLVRDRTRFRAANALQYFNIQSDARRAELLRSIDYIVVSKRRYDYYYLKYDPLARGKSDPFRQAVVTARKGRSTNLYGYALVPIEVSHDWIMLKVEPEQSAS